MTGVLREEGKRHTGQKMPCDNRGRWTKMQQGLLATTRSGRTLSGRFQRGPGPADTCITDSQPPDCEAVNSVVLNMPVVGTSLWQPWETDRVPRQRLLQTVPQPPKIPLT